MIKGFILDWGNAKERAELEQFLEGSNSVAQQTLVWCDIQRSIAKDDKAFYFIARDSETGTVVGAMPAFITSSKKYGPVMNSIPYHGNYGGVTVSEGILKGTEGNGGNTGYIEEVYQVLVDAATKAAKESKCTLFSIVSHPFVDDRRIYEKTFRPDYTYENFMLYLDIDKPLKLNKKVRWNIEKAKKKGITVVEEQTVGNVHEFYRLFKILMQHFNSRCVEEQFFIDVLEKMVPKGKAKFLFAQQDGRIIAGILMLMHKGVVDYIYTAFDMGKSDLQPNSLLISHAIGLAPKYGFRIWNWQSTKARDNSVFRFKMKWGSLEGRHFYYTKVLGDISRFMSADFSELRREYTWYYILPKFAWEGKHEGKHE